ncbi:dipeptidase [Candidatus Promineifilum breve]|nr:dipeptidase [Candidatus Promineifilum breve]
MPEQPILFAQHHHADYLDELIEFLRIPSVSTQPDHGGDVAAAAAWLARAMSAAGLENVRLIETAGHPILYGDWLHAGAGRPTVLVYGHYDVQPPEPLELWESPPFTPVVRDDFLYARGASDDKGQVYVHVKAVEAYLRTLGRLPVNVKFLVEGEEEIGSRHLHSFITANRDLLAADSALVSDSSILAPDRPALIYGLRGICQAQVDLTGPSRDLHSGSYGGGIDNPINVLGHLIARLKDERGHVLIPGFYDRVRPLTADERETLAQFPLDEAEWLAEAGAPVAWGEPEYTLVERLGARPTLDVTGLIGGYTGVGVKTVLPAQAQAKISMRLVPDQDPAEIIALFERHVRAVLPPSVTATISFGGGSPAALLETNTPTMRAAAQAYEATFGRPPVFMREGGSIPVVNQFAGDLGLPTVLMGFGLPDDRIHSPNERFYLPNYYRGIETVIRYFDLLGSAAD